MDFTVKSLYQTLSMRYPITLFASSPKILADFQEKCNKF